MVSWNCNGRLKAAISAINKFTPSTDIIHLSETKHNNFTDFNTPIGYVPISRPGIRLGDTDRGGNIIFLKKFLYRTVRKTSYFEWGVVLYFNDVTIVFLYLVPDDSRYYRDESLTELFTILNNIMKQGKNGICIGDHNGRLGKLSFANFTYTENVDKTKNSQGEIVSRIYDTNKFYVINHLCVEGKQFPGCFTFRKGDKKSQIDFVFTNSHEIVTNLAFDDLGFATSDHTMVRLKFLMNIAIPSTALLKWARDSVKTGFEHKEKLFRMSFDINATKMKTILEAKMPSYSNGLLNSSIGISDGVTQLQNIIEESFTQCRLDTKSVRNDDEDLVNLDGKQLWERIDWTGKLSGGKSVETRETPDENVTFNYFKSLYAPEGEPSVDDVEVDNPTYVPATDDILSMEEIGDALKQQKSGYNFNNTHVKPLKDMLLFSVYLLFNTIFFTTNAIVNWAPSVLFIIPKKGNLRLITNWRGIQMSEFLNAWYDRILGNRLKSWMKVDEFQTAYQKGKSCNTQIFTLRTISELAKKNNMPLFIAYIDLAKAFDRVRRSTMLKVLLKQGLGSRMFYALKSLYRSTRVFIDKIGTFISTTGIRQGSSSSVYIFIIFVNGLFCELRKRFAESTLFGQIHNLIHADDTIVMDTDKVIMVKKTIATFQYFDSIDQAVNIGKSKYMCLSNKNEHNRDDLVIEDQIMKYSEKEKYLGHYITDDNSIVNSVDCDIKERASNVIIKLRNFINNHKNVSLKIRLKVFQACFCSCILSNCEIWGPCFPRSLVTLYNKGLRIVLQVRSSTPTAIIFLESRQPSVEALVKKRQLNFWKKLDVGEGTEMKRLIERAENTKYIQYYMNLEKLYQDGNSAFNDINNKYYNKLWNGICTAEDKQTKIKTYHKIYNNCTDIPESSLCLENDGPHNVIFCKYVTSSHDLESEKGRWAKREAGNRPCKQCSSGNDETIQHFLLVCARFHEVRREFNLHTRCSISDFFKLKHAPDIIHKMHQKRR